MNLLPHSIDDLLEIADSGEGGRACLTTAAKMLQFVACRLMLVGDAAGRLIVAQTFDTGVQDGIAERLAARLSRRLRTRATCTLPLAISSEPGMAIAAWLTPRSNRTFVACLVGSEAASGVVMTKAAKASLLVGALAWAGMTQKTRELELTARIKQIEAEQESLRGSYARILTDALEEHEKRLRDQDIAQQELNRLHACNRLILDSAGEGIVGLDKQGVVTFANPTAERTLGWDSSEMVGQSFTELVRSAKVNRQPHRSVDTPIHKTLHEGVTHWGKDESFRRKDGTTFPVEYVATPMRENSDVVGAVVTLQDITERKVMEGQLVQAQKLESIGQLSAGIAHEINTPTQFIGDNLRFLADAFAELLPCLAATSKAGEQACANGCADREYLVEEIPKAIAQSLEGVERVAEIVRSMKEFSHPGGDEMQSVDLNRALASAATVCRNEWKYVADLVMDLDPALPMVMCLPGACNQVFLNLIINASHAIADKQNTEQCGKGTIALSTRATGGWVEIRVADSGTGILEEHRAKVFDPFFTTKDVGRGTGQGLAIAHSVVVEKHGGQLSFETEVGRGTTFIVRLPNATDPSRST